MVLSTAYLSRIPKLAEMINEMQKTEAVLCAKKFNGYTVYIIQYITFEILIHCVYNTLYNIHFHPGNWAIGITGESHICSPWFTSVSNTFIFSYLIILKMYHLMQCKRERFGEDTVAKDVHSIGMSGCHHTACDKGAAFDT